MRKIILFTLFALFISGCKVFQPSVMLRTPKNFQYSTYSDSALALYKISPNDIIQFRILANDGFKLIDLGGEGANNMNQFQNNTLSYLVEFDGTIKLPILGRIKLAGLSDREAEMFLEEKYKEYYNNPFVMLTITNKRVILFPGSEGTARVIMLTNENTTLIEALASAGGISQEGKAKKIKLIRKNDNVQDIYLIDLSTIDGIKHGDMVLQANDIIYIEPVFNVSRELIAEITPIISLLSSALIVYTVIVRLQPTK